MLNLTIRRPCLYIRRPTAKEKNEQREKRKTRGDYISPRITKTIMPKAQYKNARCNSGDVDRI